MICGVWAEPGTPASLGSVACCEPADEISLRFRRTTLRVALLLRGVPLVQLVLTRREAEVAGLVVDGYTNAEIARMLGMSERTVDGHLEKLKQKMCETRRARVAIRLKELGYEGGGNTGTAGRA
jgi:DNA-binding NarL/FixJ family response regulator